MRWEGQISLIEEFQIIYVLIDTTPLSEGESLILFSFSVGRRSTTPLMSAVRKQKTVFPMQRRKRMNSTLIM